MADTASPILLQRIQSVGSNVNLWGDYVNTDLKMIEQASKGYQSLAVTGDATISWTNYTLANTGSAARLKLTGSPSAAATLTFPAYHNFLSVENTTGQTVTIKCSGGTGVAIPTGQKVLIYCDGVDYYNAAPTIGPTQTQSTNTYAFVQYGAFQTYVTAAINAASTNLNGAFFSRYTYTADGGETSVSGADDRGNTLAYTVGLQTVTLNGSVLVNESDYTASTGTSITGLDALEPDDVLEVIAWASYAVANTYTQAQTNALFAAPPVGVGSSTPTTGAFTTLSSSTGLSVTAGGATITAGGLTVSAGGAAITGNSTVTGTLGVTSTVTAGTANTYQATLAGGNAGYPAVGTSGFGLLLYCGGTNSIDLRTGGSSGPLAASFTHTASANSYLTVTGGNGVGPTIGSSANEIRLAPFSGTVKHTSNSGQIEFSGSGTNSINNSGGTNFKIRSVGADAAFFEANSNVAFGGSAGSYGSGQGVVFIANRTAAPSGSPTGGGILYVESGALKFKGSSGTVTTVANA